MIFLVMIRALLGLGLAALAATSVAPTIPSPRRLTRPPPLVNTVVATNGSGTFEQLLDHDDPAGGTFSQRFWWNDEFWAGPGSPVRSVAELM